MAQALKEHLLGAPDLRSQEVAAAALDHLAHQARAALLFGGADMTGHLLGAGAAAHRVRKDMHLGKTDLLDEVHRSLKILLGLAREADHDVGGHGGIVKGGAQITHDLCVGGAVVVAVHRAQRFVTAALQGEMELRAELLLCREPRDQRRVHLLRLDGAEAYARDPLDGAGGLYRVGEVKFLAQAVCRQIDADQHDLAVAAPCDLLDLAAQIFERLGAHASSGIGNDAVGAKAVAAVLDFDEGAGVFVKGRHRQIFVGVDAAVGGDLDQGAAVSEVCFDRRHQSAALLVAEDDVALRKGAHLLGERLRHTARQHDDPVGVLPPDAVDQLAVLGVADRRDRAGIDDRDVRFFFVLRQNIAVTKQLLAHCLRFVLIDLAAERKYIKIHNFVLPFY